MLKFRTTVALVTALTLVGCQTLDGVTVNGSALNNRSIKEAQAWGCGWACAVGLGVAGAIVIGLTAGAVAAATAQAAVAVAMPVVLAAPVARLVLAASVARLVPAAALDNGTTEKNSIFGGHPGHRNAR